MTLFAAFTPHGTKIHATKEPEKPSGFKMERTSLCGAPVYNRSPNPVGFDQHVRANQDVCARCLAASEAGGAS